MKKLCLLLLALVMVFALVGCKQEDESIYEPDLSNLPEVQGHDFEEEIDDFVENSFNTYYLEVGEKEKAGHFGITDTEKSKTYTSDESVATVSKKGTITAEGKGTAYILVQTGIITGESREQFEKMGTNVDGTCEVYKVVVGKEQSMFSFLPDEMSPIIIIVGIFFALFFIVVIVIIINVIRTMGQIRKTSAQVNANQGMPFGNTVPNYQAPADFGQCRCPHCGEQLESNSTFCPYCGGKIGG